MISTKKAELQDYDCQSLIFEFTFADNKDNTHKKCQTDVIEQVDQQTNTQRSGRSVKFQFDGDNLLKQQQLKQQQEAAEQGIQISEEQIDQFVDQVYGLFEDALNDDIKYLYNYQPQWESSDRPYTLEYNLTINNEKNQAIQQKQIFDVKWNCSGYILAALVGQIDQTKKQPSIINLWNLKQRNFQLNQEIQQIQCDDEIIVIEFHLNKPNLLVGGSIYGQIFLWDTDTLSLICKSDIDIYKHSEAITQLIWQEYKIPGSTDIYDHLYSLSTDGKLLIWRFQEQKQNSFLNYPIKGFSLVETNESEFTFKRLSGRSMAATLEDKNTFIIGSEFGDVFRCVLDNVNDKKNPLLDQNRGLKWNQETIPFLSNLPNQNLVSVIDHLVGYAKKRQKNEIFLDDIFDSKPDINQLYARSISFYYEQHYGPVNTLSFSPFHRNLFLTCSSDQTIKIFDQIEKKSQIQFDFMDKNIQQAHWSIHKPAVFYVSSSDGEIMIFDLIKDIKYCSETIQSPNKQKQAFQIVQNKKLNDLIAVSYEDGTIAIYQIAEKYVQSQQNDLQFLNSIIENMKVVQ